MTKRTEEALRAAGMRVTPERGLLLDALAKARHPVSSKELHESVAGAMDRVTVYRNLETFVISGVARRIDVGHRHAHYEAAGDEHHHLICTRCGRMEDVAYCPDPRSTARLLKASRHFSAIERHALEFYGVCNACARS